MGWSEFLRIPVVPGLSNSGLGGCGRAPRAHRFSATGGRRRWRAVAGAVPCLAQPERRRRAACDPSRRVAFDAFCTRHGAAVGQVHDGKTVGFCSEQCAVQWDKMSSEERAAKLAGK